MYSINTAAIALAMTFSALAFAGKAADLPACSSVTKACEAAGFNPGEHKKDGKGLWVDCVHALAKGKTVPGVSVSQADAKACSDAAKAERKEKKHGK